VAKLTLLTIPIGNLGDITSRVSDALKGGGSFLVEDTRSFFHLMNALDIETTNCKVDSFHDQSDNKKIGKIISRLNNGEDLFLLSEAGSPVVSDPAYPLVVLAIENGHKIESYSGISAVINALELSGLPPCPFHFHGFSPREKGKQVELFNSIEQISGTHIFYESPHRIIKFSANMAKYFPDSKIVIVRELTKKFEAVYRFYGSEFNNIKNDIITKGEFVILVNIDSKVKSSGLNISKIQENARRYLEKGGGTKQLSKILSELAGLKTSEVYDILNRKLKE